jgi:beta-galactosidase
MMIDNNSPQLNIAVLDDALDIDPGSANWSSPKMISHWNFPKYENQLMRVHTFSNCDSVALWVNKRSPGKRAVADYPNNTIEWNVPYIRGTLKATGYRDGKETLTTELQTAGEPVDISLRSLFPFANADGQDVAIVEVLLKDKEPIGTNALSTYFGRCIAIVRTGKNSGDIVLSAKGEGLNESSISIPVK